MGRFSLSSFDCDAEGEREGGGVCAPRRREKSDFMLSRVDVT
jgi:hypothetical protein